MVQPSDARRKHLLAFLASKHAYTDGAAAHASCQHLLRGNHIELAYFLPNLRGWRLAFGLSMEALYMASGVELKTIRALERGTRAARLGTIGRLADALTLSNLQLVTVEPPAPDSLDYCRPTQALARADDAGLLGFQLPLLRSTRYFAGFSRLALADAAGVTTRRLADLEMRHEFATVQEIAAIANALGKSPESLISWP